MGTDRLVRAGFAAPALRAAIIGGGRIGAGFDTPGTGSVLTHAAAYQASPRTELVAICDVRPEIAAARAREWNVPGFVDVGELLAHTLPEVVSICTPDETHAALAHLVLQAPSVRGLLMEKPLALSVPDAARVVALAEARGVTLGVNYSRRWADGVRGVASLLRDRHLGPVQAVTGHVANGWLHNGTHWVDLARMLIGDITSVRALHPVDSNVSDAPLDVELVFECGARGVVLGHAGAGLSFFEMDIVCERGRVRLSRGAEQIDVFALAPSAVYAGFVAHTPVACHAGGLAGALRTAIEDVATCVSEGGAPACSGADALQAVRVADAALRSAGMWTCVGEAA